MRRWNEGVFVELILVPFGRFGRALVTKCVLGGASGGSRRILSTKMASNWNSSCLQVGVNWVKKSMRKSIKCWMAKEINFLWILIRFSDGKCKPVGSKVEAKIDVNFGRLIHNEGKNEWNGSSQIRRSSWSFWVPRRAPPEVSETQSGSNQKRWFNLEPKTTTNFWSLLVFQKFVVVLGSRTCAPRSVWNSKRIQSTKSSRPTTQNNHEFLNWMNERTNRWMKWMNKLMD